MRGKILNRFDWVVRKIDLFLQLAGRGRVQLKRSIFDDCACSTSNVQDEEARMEDEVITKYCSHEEVTLTWGFPYT